METPKNVKEVAEADVVFDPKPYAGPREILRKVVGIEPVPETNIDRASLPA